MRFLLVSFFAVFLLSCKSVQIKKSIQKRMKNSFNENHFTGIFVYDPKKKDTLINYNGNKYFTPASNTKIATLYTALQMLEDKIPSYTYEVNLDTITIQGTGNPTFLHPHFKDSTLVNTLQQYKHINILTSNLNDTKYGYGWAWEDYDTYFSPERSAFPFYGNVVSIKRKDSLQITPSLFYKYVNKTLKKQGREPNENIFYYKQHKKKDVEIPFIVDKKTTEKLWKKILPSKTLKFYHDSIASLKNKAFSTVYIDSLYKRMMVKSDNFLAEQILILASSKLSDTLSSSQIRKHILKNQLANLQQPPRWVDGSGLSRYNLFTPSSFVYILNKMYADIPRKRLFDLFPVGGVSGTLKNWYNGEENPYVYAKSGTLSNNYSLSGYLITKSNRILIFSIMNNHFKQKTSDVKKQVQLILEAFRDTY